MELIMLTGEGNSYKTSSSELEKYFTLTKFLFNYIATIKWI